VEKLSTESTPIQICFKKTVPDTLQEYFKKVKNSPIEERILFQDGHKSQNPNPQAEIKYLPKQFFTPLTLNVFGDKVALTDFVDPATTMIIKKQSFADGFKEYFNMLWQQDARTYRGVDSVYEFMLKSLDYKENWFIGGNAGMERAMPVQWLEYNKLRLERKVWWHDLVDIKAKSRLTGLDYVREGERHEDKYFEFKWLPEEVCSPTVIFMFGETVASITWEADPEPVAFVIENKQIFNDYKKYFDYLWNQDTRITRGLKNAQDLFYRKMRELKAGDEYRVLWGAYGIDVRNDTIPWFEKYNTERVQRGVHLKLIGYEPDRDSILHEMKAAGDTDLSMTSVRFLDNAVESPMQINIYPDSIIFFHWAKGSGTIAIEIKRPEIRDAMNTSFDATWQASKN